MSDFTRVDGCPLSPNVRQESVGGYRTRLTRPVGIRPNPLGPREKEVAQLLSQGLTTHSIAKRLGIAVATVRSTSAHAVAKLAHEGVYNRVQLKSWARRYEVDL